MGETIKASSEGLREFISNYEAAGAEYKKNLGRLESLIQEITNGDITGNPAQDILNKFNAKKDVFNALRQSIENAQGYVEDQKRRLSSTLSDLNAAIK